MSKFFAWLNSNYPNWKTTAAGLFAASFLAAHDFLSNGGKFTWSGMFSAVGVASLGYMSKYYKTTGGTLPQTPEAVNRAEPIEKVKIQPEVKNEVKP